MTNTNQCGNKDKLSSDATTRIRDSLNRSSEMSINDVFPHCITEIKNLRLRNVNKVIIGNLNINSLPNKFDQLREIVLKYVDVLVVTETKLDDTFLTSQFLVTGFSVPYRLDRNRNRVGIMIFIRDDIPSRVLTKHVFPDDIEGLFIELNFRKAKWLLFGTYHPPSQSDSYYFNNLDKALDLYSHYNKKLLVGDFNTEVSDVLSIFLYQHDLENLVKDKTCFKNANNPSTIDLFLTNNSLAFQNTTATFTGLSDCHKLVLTVLKTIFSKNKPKELFYRDYKKFNFSDFNNELKNIFSRNTVGSCYQFEQIFLNVLDKHAPMKRKLLRANHSAYISKPLRKAIMRRSHLEKVYYKNKSEKSFKAYKKQKNFCSRLYKNERKRFFNNLNPSFVTDNKLFWKTIKPFFSNKVNYGSQIKLVEKDEVLQDDDQIAKELNKFFMNAVSTLNIKENRFITNRSSDGITDPVDKAIDKYKFHPSILLIQKHLKNHDIFSFKTVDIGDIKKEINSINPKKATTSNGIPPKILKKSSKVSASVLHKLFNDSIEKSDFPQNLKLADITPVYKKNDPLDKTNYRPVSILPVVSKIFEIIMQKQINDCIISFLSPYLCGYRKGFNTQHALLTLVENWRKSLDNKGFGGAILMDLSKAFDTLNHDLLIAKLHAHGFQHDALKLLHSYLSKRWHRTKVNTSFSS